MAERSLTTINIIGASPNPLGQAAKVMRIRWSNLNAGDTGERLPVLDSVDIVSVHVHDVNGHTVVMQGSNGDEVAAAPEAHWVTLPDETGSDFSAAANSIHGLSALGAFIRPSVTGGTGACIVDLLVMKRG